MNHYSNRLPPEDESGGRKKKSQQSLSADQLGHLVSRSMEGEITEAETELLQHHLKTDESAQDFFVEFASVHAMLTCHFQPLDLLETTGSEIRLVHRVKKRKNKNKNWNALKSWQIALIASVTITSVLVVVIGWSLLFSKPVPPEIVEVPSKIDQTVQPANTDWKGKRQTLTTGTLELHFPTGAKALVVAPATFIITGDNSVRLLTGKLVANVPESGIGFTVDTPRGRVVDLGTTFSVHATKELNTVVQVFRGKVIASLVDDKGVIQTSRQIEENHAVNIDFLKEGLVDIPYASNDFDANIQKEFGIVSHSKTVVFQEKAMPTSVAIKRHNNFEHDDLAFLFLEERNVLLEQELEVYSTKVSGDQDNKQYSYQKKLIPAETKVDSFFLFYNPKDNESLLKSVQGVIQFDRPILGIIVGKKAFLESDQLFRPPEENRTNVILDRSVSDIDVNKKIFKSSPGQDYVILSEDRKKLTFRLAITKMGTDEFRVILKSHDVPDH